MKLQKYCCQISTSSQRSDIDDIRAIKEEAKEKALLPYYKKWQRNEILTPSLSDTVLDGESLSSAFPDFQGKG